MAASPARRLAFHYLAAVETRAAYLSELQRGPEARVVAPRDRALALELALGTLRRQSELDFLADHAAGRTLRNLPRPARLALRLGLYQLRHSRVPAVAAVHESVELAKMAGPRAAALVNAVLRRAAAAAPASLEELLGAEEDPLRRRAIRLSHPDWLLARWEARRGEAAAQAMAEFDNETPVPALRPVGVSRDELAAELRAEGLTVAPGRLLTSALRVPGGARAAAALAGRAVAQDEASQLIPHLLAPAGAPRIADACAAPGNKTAMLSALAPAADILALELHPHRARQLRLRAPRARVLAADAAAPWPVRATFDRILVDAPCSGAGTLQRHPEIRWRLRPADLPALAARQLALLRRAASHLAPGGRLAYSVCSLEPEEGSEVVANFLREHPGFRLLPAGDEARRLEAEGVVNAGVASDLSAGDWLEIPPGRFATEGFFAALLLRAPNP